MVRPRLKHSLPCPLHPSLKVSDSKHSFGNFIDQLSRSFRTAKVVTTCDVSSSNQYWVSLCYR